MFEYAIIMPIATSVVASVVVGFGSAWLASQRALATYGQRLKAVEAAVDAASLRERNITERFIRLETKIDLLLAGRLHGESHYE